MRILRMTLLLLAVAGCDAGAPATHDSARVLRAPDNPAAAEQSAPKSTWNASAGSVLLVAGDQPGQAIVVSPDVDGIVERASLDVTELVGAEARLIGRAGNVSSVTLGAESAESGSMPCNAWPVVGVPASTPAWSVGFLEPSVTPIALDSVHSKSRRDSIALVSSVARLASGIAVTGTGEHAPSFHALPFVVADVRLFSHDSVDVAVAQVVRRVNQEASPLEEHTLIIAERPAGGEWRVARVEQSAGREDTVVRQDVLAAVRLDAEPMLVFIRDSGSEIQYIIRWRSSGAWSREWSSAVSRC